MTRDIDPAELENSSLEVFLNGEPVKVTKWWVDHGFSLTTDGVFRQWGEWGEAAVDPG